MDWLKSQFELSRSGSELNSRPMEGLRGYAVTLVFLVHYATLVAPWIGGPSLLASVADALHTIGNSGVDLFFVLSGYLIYGSLIERRQQFLRFIRRRIARIYPAFSVVFIIYLALSAAFPHESKIPAAPLDGALYIAQNYLLLSGFSDRSPIITVSWSLSYEMCYYLAIPLLIAAFGLRERSARWRVGFFAGILLAATACCLIFGGPLRMTMFIAGILLHETMSSKRSGTQAPSTSSVLLALVIGMGLMLTPAAPVFKFSGLFIAFFLLCLACFRQPSGLVGRSCGLTPVRWLGNMSYSYYLLHGLALKAAFSVLAAVMPPALSNTGNWWFFAGWMAPMFVWTLLPSAALFLLVERPYSLAPHAAVSRKATLQRT